MSTWNVAYRKRRFIFSHDDTYHHTLMTEPRDYWEQMPLSAARRTSASRGVSGLLPVSRAAATRSGSITRSPTATNIA